MHYKNKKLLYKKTKIFYISVKTHFLMRFYGKNILIYKSYFLYYNSINFIIKTRLMWIKNMKKPKDIQFGC